MFLLGQKLIRFKSLQVTTKLRCRSTEDRGLIISWLLRLLLF